MNTNEVDKAVEQLLEHFDTVQILVTKHCGNKDRTDSYEAGGGNFYARQAHVAEWLTIQKQYQKEWAKKQYQKEWAKHKDREDREDKGDES